jgi:hypothetical protein
MRNLRVVPAAAEARAGHHSAFSSVPSSSARRSRPVPLFGEELTRDANSRSGFRNAKAEGSFAHPRSSAERGSSPGNLARLWGRVHRRHSPPRPRIQGPNRCCPPLPTASEGRWDERRCWCPAWSGTACRPPIPLLVELAAPFARFDGTQHRGCPTFQNCNVWRLPSSA